MTNASAGHKNRISRFSVTFGIVMIKAALLGLVSVLLKGFMDQDCSVKHPGCSLRSKEVSAQGSLSWTLSCSCVSVFIGGNCLVQSYGNKVAISVYCFGMEQQTFLRSNGTITKQKRNTSLTSLRIFAFYTQKTMCFKTKCQLESTV